MVPLPLRPSRAVPFHHREVTVSPSCFLSAGRGNCQKECKRQLSEQQAWVRNRLDPIKRGESEKKARLEGRGSCGFFLWGILGPAPGCLRNLALGPQRWAKKQALTHPAKAARLRAGRGAGWALCAAFKAQWQAGEREQRPGREGAKQSFLPSGEGSPQQASPGALVPPQGKGAHGGNGVARNPSLGSYWLFGFSFSLLFLHKMGLR